MAHSFDLKDLFSSFGFGKKRYTKTPTPPQTINLMNGVSQILTPKNWDAYDIAMTTAEVYAVIHTRAVLLSSGTWKHYKMVKGEKVEVDNSPFVKFLEQPNVLMNGNDYIYLLDLCESIYGNTYESLVKGFSSDKLPKAMYILPPNEIKLKTTGMWYTQLSIEDMIDYYEYCKDRIDVKDIIHRRIPSIKNPLLGESPMNPLYMQISNIRTANEFRNTAMVKKGAFGILSNSSTDVVGARSVTKKERQRINDQYNKDYGIDESKGQVIITDAQLNYQNMTFPLRDFMLFEGISSDFNRIIDAYGLNINIFSKEKGSTFENLSQGLKQAFQSTIIPKSEILSMNKTKEFGMDSSVEFVELDYSHIPVLQENMKEQSEVIKNKANAIQTLVNSGIPIDEARVLAKID